MCLFIQQISPEHSSKPGIARCWDYRNNKAWNLLSRVANVQQPSTDAGMIVGTDVQGDRGTLSPDLGKGVVNTTSEKSGGSSLASGSPTGSALRTSSMGCC